MARRFFHFSGLGAQRVVVAGAMFAIFASAARADDRVLKPGAAKPAQAVVLFDGSDTSKWVSAGSDRPCTFKVEDGALVAAEKDIETKDKFGAFQLHLEWTEPESPPSAHGEARGNSGVYLQGRYEIQVLDSYGTEKPGKGDCGAVYDQTAPLKNVCKKPGEWQTYDITFRPAEFKDGKKTKDAHVTVYQNGELVQDNTDITGSTGGGAREADTPGPIRLQYHGSPVRFRNLWVVAMDEHAAAPKKKRDTLDPNAWYNKMDYGPFVSATIVSSFPKDNTTYKGVAVKLGKEEPANILFDTQLMRVAAGWTDGFIKFDGVAYTGAHGVNPSLAGEQKFGTHNAPGWAHEGIFRDPRPEPFGGMPRDYMHYRGLYRHGDQIVFSYTIGDMEVLELPGVEGTGPHLVFTRTFEAGPSKSAQTMVVSDLDSGKGGVGPASQNIGTDKKGPADKTIAVIENNGEDTAAGLVGAAAGATWEVADDRGPSIRLTLPPHEGTEKFKLVIWSGPSANLASFAGALKPGDMTDVAALCKGGPARWTEELTTQGQPGGADPKTAKSAYVVDDITPPKENPWHSFLRFGGFDLFPDGKSAALCTWNGDVWIVKGIDDKLEHLTWKRYAAGLFQTLGLKIVNGDIYVMGRDQITHLHDLNGDGEADFYENFNNDVTVAPAFHEFAFDLQQDAEGNFYFAKAGGVKAGGRGFERPITADQGTVMKVSKDGSRLDVVATGFRAPNGMCVSPDGQIVTGDNQGSWIPVDRINWVKPGGFYGVPDLAHRTPEPSTTDNPICWMVYPGWDNSNGDPIFCTSDRFGPFKGELLYLSYGQCHLFNVMKEERDGEIQGGVSRFPVEFDSGSMRARFGEDGNLYVCGLKGWQTTARRDTCFQRVRYTGKPVHMPIALHVKDDGIEITFTDPVKKDSAADPGAWDIQQWNYHYSSDYGSGEYSVADPAKKGHDTVEVKSAKLSDDGKTLFLGIDNLQPVMQMLIRGEIEAADGTQMKVEIANTINAVKGKKMVLSTK